MLQELLSPELLPDLLGNNRQIKFFPPASDRSAWDKISSGQAQQFWRQNLLEQAQALTGTPWAELTASLFMAYIRDGSRTAYEVPYFSRRNRLGLMVLAECFEYRGRYLEEIVNGIWHILSEPDWCLPAHSEYLPDDPLAKPYTARVDLFCAVTGMQLAETVQLLGAELRKISPSLVERLSHEVISRVVVPVENFHEKSWWLDGFNNWTPWCSFNVTGCALTFLNDAEREAVLISKLLRANERFIANYKPDGGCDEGPMYWTVAGGKLMMLMDMLDQATGGALAAAFKSPLFRNMGDYIASVHLCNDWFLSPADSGARGTHMSSGQIYHFGALSGSEHLQRIALAAIYGFNPGATHPPVPVLSNYCGNFLTFMLRNFFWLPEHTAYQEPVHKGITLLPDLQIFIARENPMTPDKGMILSLKGGHNAESHNHNDIGQFELFCDGSPVIIDTGVASYCRQTFSDRRYDLWYIGAQGHNIPAVNGVLQQPGYEFKAVIISHSATGNGGSMALDLTAAYPAAAGIQKYTRCAELNVAAKTASISDQLAIRHGLLQIDIPLHTPVEPVIAAPDLVCWQLAHGRIELKITGLTAENLEAVTLEDERMIGSWGKKIYRFHLTGKFQSGSGEWRLSFTRNS